MDLWCALRNIKSIFYDLSTLNNRYLNTQIMSKLQFDRYNWYKYSGTQ